MNLTKIILLGLLTLVLIENCLCDKSLDEDIEELTAESGDDDEEEEKEPFAKRQFNSVRDSMKNAFGSGYKLLSTYNGRLVKGVSSAVSAASSAATSAASSAVSAASSAASAATSAVSSQRPSKPGSVVNNIFKTVRNGWNRHSESASALLLKQLDNLSKRISFTSPRLILGNIGSRLTNREESATKNTKADTAVEPTALPSREKAVKSVPASSVSAVMSEPRPSEERGAVTINDYIRKFSLESNKGVYVMPPPSFAAGPSANDAYAYAAAVAAAASSTSPVAVAAEPSNSLPSIYNMNHMYGLHINPMYEHYGPLYPPIV